jgi:hypothetical protein
MRGRKKKGTAFGETPEPTPATARAPRENLFGEAPDAAREAVRAGLAQPLPSGIRAPSALDVSTPSPIFAKLCGGQAFALWKSNK